MYHVKELARLAGVTEHTIRFYTDQGSGFAALPAGCQ